MDICWLQPEHEIGVSDVHKQRAKRHRKDTDLATQILILDLKTTRSSHQPIFWATTLLKPALPRDSLEVFDHSLSKATAAHWLNRWLHQTCQVIGDLLIGNGSANALGDQIRGFLPAHVFEHHHAAQDH